jgi:hypothetical protein
VRFNGRWRFTFDYERLLGGFAAVFERTNIIVRRYDSGKRDVVGDFCRVIGADAPLRTGRIVMPGRLNAAVSFAGVVQRFECNVARLGDDARAPKAPSVWAAGRFDPVQLPQVRQIVARFNGGNTRVYERYGTLVPCVGGATSSLMLRPRPDCTRRAGGAAGCSTCALERAIRIIGVRACVPLTFAPRFCPSPPQRAAKRSWC